MTKIVAEIGQNHQGSVETAKDLCEMAARPRRSDFMGDTSHGADAIKLTKRDLDAELAASARQRRYTGRKSFGATYGDHREALELSWGQTRAVAEHADALGLQVGITLCAPSLVEGLPFTPAFLKVASRDLTHGPLIRALAATHLPLVLSTGMHGPPEIDAALEIVTRYHDDVTLLHCVSAYPTEPQDVHLLAIDELRVRYPAYDVGLSDHTIGLVAPVMAVALGASMIEKHVTLWRGMRGSDHEGALGPDGLWRLCRDIRKAERMLGRATLAPPDVTREAREKLERSLAASEPIEVGTVMGSSNTTLLSPGTGIPWTSRDKVYGKKATRPIDAHELVLPESLAERGVST